MWARGRRSPNSARCRKYGCCRETTVLGLLRRQLPDRRRTGRRASLGRRRPQDCRANACGASAPAVSCWRPGQSNGPWSFPTTTGPGSCWRARSRTYLIVMRWRRDRARCCSSTTTAPIRWRRRWRGPGRGGGDQSIRGPSRGARGAPCWPTGFPLYSGPCGYRNRRDAAALRRVRVRPSAAAEAGRGRSVTLDCDLLAVSGGWNPNVQLFAQTRGRLRFDPGLAAPVPDESDAAVACAGAANGIFRSPPVSPEGKSGGAGRRLVRLRPVG